MKRIAAIAVLTLRAAFRFRLVVALLALLLGAVVILPVIVKHDGTAQGFTQILLTYTLSAITGLLGMATLWLACGTLARDIEECQIQMVISKPVARWEVWIGKWIGILMLNAALLAVSGGAVYGLLQYRAGQLPAAEQQKLRNEVLVARGSAKEELPDFTPMVDKMVAERLKEANVAVMDRGFVRRQIEEQVKGRYQLVPPGTYRPWKINLGTATSWLKDQPIYIRVKFNSAEKSPSGTFPVLWQFGPPETARVWRKQSNLAPDTFHEFEIPPNLFDEKGVLTIVAVNPNETALLFPIGESMEVLYRTGGFGTNFIRGLGVIFSWFALLAAIGLTAASFLSFPVATFFSLSVLFVGLSSGTISQVVEEGGLSGVDHDTGKIENVRLIDRISVPIFKGLKRVVNLFQEFSPIDALSTGRSVTWQQLGSAWFQICVLLGGAFAIPGMIIFHRRELAVGQTGV